MSATTMLQPCDTVIRAAMPRISGPILARWNSLGGAGGLLGAAQAGDTVCPDGVGRRVHFAGGSIHWSPATGAFSVHGPILAKWSSLGWERCPFLGYPVTDEIGCLDGVGRFSHFQSGSIYWTARTGAFSVHGAIRDKWASLGRERGALGYPVSDEGDLGGGARVSTFQNGRIGWTAVRGAWVEMTTPSLPPQLEYTFSPIVLDGVPAAGFAHLTIRRDGRYIFSGHLHGSGATALVCAIKDTGNQAYSFAHTGTSESGAHDDWNMPGSNPAIAANWANLVGGSSVGMASASLDVAALGGRVIAELGDVAKVVGIVGQPFASDGDTHSVVVNS